MNGRSDRDWFVIGLLALEPMLPATASAADAPPSQPQQTHPAEEQLDEVVVTGHRSHEKNPQREFNWLARLVGEFTIDGYVDPQAKGNPGDFLQAQGQAQCFGFGIGPGVMCELRVRWPEAAESNDERMLGGISTLNPAVMLFGFYRTGGLLHRADYGITQTLIDDKGIAEYGVGYSTTADTVVSRSPCVAIPGNCERMVRITAGADLQTVEMQIELEIRQQKAVSYDIVMHRVPGSKSMVYGRESPAEQEKQK